MIFINLFSFLLLRFDPVPWHGLPLRGCAVTLTGHTTHGRAPLDETSTWHHTKITTNPCPPSPAEFKLAIPACDRRQTQALDRTAIGFGSASTCNTEMFGKLNFISACHSQVHKFCHNGHEHSPFREATVNSAWQEMTRILCNPKIQYRVCMSYNWTLPWASPVQSTTSHSVSYNCQMNITVPSTAVSTLQQAPLKSWKWKTDRIIHDAKGNDCTRTKLVCYDTSRGTSFRKLYVARELTN